MKLILSRVKRYQTTLICFGYLIFFGLLLFPGHHGLGLFWDWDWPIFSNHVTTIFNHESHSWVDSNLGRPLLYQSAYYIRYVLSLLRYLNLNPEVLLYYILIIITSASAYGVYLIARRKLSAAAAFILGIVALCNPAYLYKLLAGHFFYLISFCIFIYFINFLFYHFKKDLKSAIVLALLMAFVGAQIQFFVLTFIVLVTFLIFNREKFQLRNIVISLVLAFLINLPWLSNFLIGANRVGDISGQAGSIAFNAAIRTGLLRIAVLSFSDATLIKFLFPKYAFAFFGLFSAGLFGLTGWKIIRLRRNNQDTRDNNQTISNIQSLKEYKEKHASEFWVVLICLIIFIFLGTGIYQSWDIPVIKTLYPMLRESGHLAPIIILFMVLLLIRLWSEKAWIKWPITGYLVIFIAINAFTVYKSLPTIDYSVLRARLAPYKEILDKDSSVYRIAAYPFFGQYSVAGEETKEVRGQPIRNTGIDVFTQNSIYDALSNYIPAQLLDQSVQFRFVETKDLSLLEERNIKYLLDFSSIYQSNVEKYSDPSYYHNDLNIIKNDPNFFSDLVAEYPGRIKLVAPGIYELTQASQRIETGQPETIIQKINPSHYKVEVKDVAENFDFKFLSNYSPSWSLVLNSDGQQVALQDHHELEDFGQVWNLKINDLKKIVGDKNIKINGAVDLSFDLKYLPEKYFKISQVVALITIVLSIILILRPKSPND